MSKFFFYILFMTIFFSSFGQEYVGMTSDDISDEFEIPLMRNSSRSTTIENYKRKINSYKKGIKSIKIKSDNSFSKTILFEKGYIISETEESPFEKSVSVYSLDSKGNLLRVSKNISRINNEGNVTSEFSDVITFIYTDSIFENHNYGENSHTYKYAVDDSGNVVEKIYISDHLKDTTLYEYDEKKLLVRENLKYANSEIIYSYNDSSKIVNIDKYKLLNGTKKSLRNKSYIYEGDKIKKYIEKSNGEENSITLNRDSIGRITNVKSQDGGLVYEADITYDEHNLIVMDGRGFNYKYKIDKKGNWIHCVVSKNGEKSRTYTREIVYEK